ncbi:MAG: transporter substrate-binding domain-containing protein [Rhizobiaceae bacterium]|nr:transporter substrate-binding domain-containing protein [Rhizobiaceae bacterium]
MLTDIIAELAPTGLLRVGVNMGNFLLVTGKTDEGDPVGVSPDMARAIADKLGVEVSYIRYASPGKVADDALEDKWDIALIADEPVRAEHIAFTKAYVEIEATYMVPEGSPIAKLEDVDVEGVRIAVSGRAAYDLYLTRHLQHATLHRSEGLPKAVELFTNEKLDALAGLRPGLIKNASDLGNMRILEGCFSTVQQAIGTPKKNTASVLFLEEFVAEAINSGLVAELIDRHNVTGKLLVAK